MSAVRITRTLVAGGAFVLDNTETVPAIWGEGDRVLWASGESLWICAPPGVGKTTIAQQLVLARLGVRPPTLLGLPVVVDERRVVYIIAADRPAQAARSWRRMVTEADRDLLDDRLLVWEGPLPFRITEDPLRLAEWLLEHDAGTVVIDSLKDVAIGLAEDAVGAAVNQAMQGVVANGIEPAVLHHQRKSQGDRKPRTLEDVYGSTWLTAGAGSVVLLWGEAGDPIVDLIHLKQPAAEVGPLTVHHDHGRGRSTVPGPVDLLDLAAHGVTAPEAARAVYDTTNPTRNQVEKVRRRLDKLADTGRVTRTREGDDGRAPIRFVLAADEKRVAACSPACSSTKPSTPLHDSAPARYTDPYTPLHAPPGKTTAPSFKKGVDPSRVGANGHPNTDDIEWAEALLARHPDLHGTDDTQ